MRILLWAPFGAGTHYWGPGTSAYRLYKTNKDQSVKITLVHACDEQGEFPDVYEKQVKLPTLKGTGIAGKISYILAAKKWIKNNYNEYDVVHGITAFEYTFRPLLYFKKLGKPVFIKITGEHGGFGENSTISKILGFSRNRIKKANEINGYIAISKKITKNLLNFNISKNKIFEIPNGVDITRFKPIDRKSKLKLRDDLGIKNVFTFIYVGGLTYNKRIIETVQAVALLKQKVDVDFQFLIVGPDRSQGLVEKEINNLIVKNKLEDVIIRKAQTLLPEHYLQVADVFTLVSKKEGMSNSLLEAMSTGLPSLVTDISGSQDLIKDRANGIYTNGSVEDILLKMNHILNKKEDLRAYGDKSRDIIEKSYSNEIILKRHIDVFKSKIKDNCI